MSSDRRIKCCHHMEDAMDEIVDALVGDAHANVNQENDACLVIEESNANNDLSKVIKEAFTMEHVRPR